MVPEPLPMRRLILGHILRNQSEHRRTRATMNDQSYRPNPWISKLTWPVYSQQEKLRAADEHQEWLAASEAFTDTPSDMSKYRANFVVKSHLSRNFNKIKTSVRSISSKHQTAAEQIKSSSNVFENYEKVRGKFNRIVYDVNLDGAQC